MRDFVSNSEPTVNIEQLTEQIRSLVNQKFYPCVAAIQALHKQEVDVHVYQNFGTGKSSSTLHQDLLKFLCQQMRTRSTLLSFFAVFPNSQVSSEDEFQDALWRELSSVSALDKSEWDPRFSSDPKSKKFCFSLAGHAFFVVGLHDKSSRQARRFAYPTLVFNVYDQFTQLAERGEYLPMIEKNRARDLKFQGSVNPMVEKHGDEWESIQFSGKENPESWKCPFDRA